MDGDLVSKFEEKPLEDGAWINGGYFVLSPEVLNLISGDDVIWERDPMQRLAADGELVAYRHDGFWRCMDTPRDKRELERLWTIGRPPWVQWTD